MASYSEQNDHNMVNTLTTILKKVNLFGYGSSDLDSSELAPPMGVDPSFGSEEPRRNRRTKKENKNTSLSGVLSSPTSISSHPHPQYLTDNSGYSNSLASTSSLSSEFTGSSSVPLAESFSSSSQFQDDYGTDFKEYEVGDIFEEEDDGPVTEYEIDQAPRSRRRHLTGVVEEPEPQLPEYSLNEVAQHDMIHDCWMVLYDKVYDVTEFLYDHPGGEDLIMEHAGRDGTISFRGVGHSKAALKSLQQYLIGQLPPHERIFSSWEIQ